MADYPLPILLIKPDLQLSDVYDVSAIEELQTDYKCFTEEDFQTALLQAQHEINLELLEEQEHATSAASRDSTPHVQARLSPIIPARHCQLIEVEQLEEDNIHKEEDYRGNRHHLSTKIVEPATRKDGTDISSKARMPQNESNASSQDNCKHTENSRTGRNEESTDIHAITDILDRLHTQVNTQEDTEDQTTIRPQAKEKVSPKKTRSKADASEEDIAYLEGNLVGMNRMFEELLQCIHYHQSQTFANRGSEDPTEKEKTSNRFKEFTARFNRQLYQASQQFVSLRTAMNRNYLSTGHKAIDMIKLKQLTRSCSNLLSSLVHFAPLAGGNFFPSRFQYYLELLVDTGTILSTLHLNSVADLARNLRRVESLHAQLQNKQMLHSTSQLQPAADNRSQLRSTTASTRKTASNSSNNMKCNSVLGGTPKSTQQQRSNLARSKQQQKQQQQQLVTQVNTKGVAKRNTQPIKTLPVNEISTIDAQRARPVFTRDWATQHGTGGITGEPMPQSVTTTDSHNTPTSSSKATVYRSLHSYLDKAAVAASMNNTITTLGEVDEGDLEEESLLEGVTPHESTVRIPGVSGNDAVISHQPLLDSKLLLDEAPTSRSKQTALKQVLNRVHNLELLALREQSKDDKSTSSVNPRDKNNAENRRPSTMVIPSVPDILDKIDVIKSDFLLIEQKYRFQS